MLLEYIYWEGKLRTFLDIIFNTKVHTSLPSPWIIKVHLLGAATSVADLVALEPIKLAIEMESESPSTICAGLKPSTSLGFGFHLAMANLPAKFKNTV